MLAAGCGGKDKPKATATPSASPAKTPARKARPRKRGQRRPPPRARRRAAKLPLKQQVGQLFVVGFEGAALDGRVFDELRGHGWGGIVISPGNAPALSGFGVLAGEARVVAQGARRVPPLVTAIDDGRPSHLGSSPSQARSAARAAATALKAQGVTLTIGPFIDVGLEAKAGLIARTAPAAIEGWLKGGVAPAPGHFPGQGTTTQNPLDGPANVGLSARDLARRDLKPFRTALRRAPAVTLSSATFTAYDPVTPAALTPAIVRGLLRKKLRFGGVAMTDNLASITAATGGSQPKAAVAALRAGIDLVYVPDPAMRERVFKAAMRAVRKKRLRRSRVRQAVARILVLKRKAGVR